MSYLSIFSRFGMTRVQYDITLSNTLHEILQRYGACDAAL
jgi:hypothetical protein